MPSVNIGNVYLSDNQINVLKRMQKDFALSHPSLQLDPQDWRSKLTDIALGGIFEQIRAYQGAVVEGRS